MSKKLTIAELKATPIRGNFLYDERLWTECEDFMLDDNPIEQKKEALRIIDTICGADEPAYSDSDIDNAIKMIRELRG